MILSTFLPKLSWSAFSVPAVIINLLFVNWGILCNSASNIRFQLYLEYVDKVYGIPSRDDQQLISLCITKLIWLLSPEKKKIHWFLTFWWNYTWSVRWMSVKRQGGRSLSHPDCSFCNRHWKLYWKVSDDGCMGDIQYGYNTTKQNTRYLLEQPKLIPKDDVVLLWQLFKH